ncbi:MAG TPA: hypothetical protein VNN09_01315 [Candidatus Competibacteraceae bacterium]|nr:hypothetical protein [Candidatus Competibacteraceae bacterium]
MPQAALMRIEEVAALIRQGRSLALAGDEAALEGLPQGRWIGGTIPYFMTAAGGLSSRERIFVHDVSDWGAQPSIRYYALDELHRVARDAPDHGVSLIIIPAGSEVHSAYARNAPNYDDMYLKPLLGWVAGVHLSELGQRAPRVYDGLLGTSVSDCAVVMHIPLPATRHALIDIVNPFQPGAGEIITFAATGFEAADCLIDGRPANLADYYRDRALDTRLPLVADYCGAPINVSIRQVHYRERRVEFYAPVFPGVEYRLARPLPDYLVDFAAAMPPAAARAVFSCNCILNYLYGELEGRQTQGMVGPFTFGEIAYQLLNQTLVYLTFDDATS